MAVKLDALPPFPGAGNPFSSFIPFSDYSRWERRPIRRSEGKTRPRPPKDSTSTVQWSSKQLPNVKSTKSSSISTKLNHRSQEPMKIVVLKNEVGAKKRSFEVYQAYIKDLLAENMSIISSIVELEKKTHTSVDGILDRYIHFKGAMHTLEIKSRQALEEAQEELEETRTRLQQEIEAQRDEVMQVDDAIESNSRYLQTLKHYKDKEFPVRQIRIERLRESLVEMHEDHMVEREELDLQIVEEREHYDHHLKVIQGKLQASATEASLAHTQKRVQDQAIQNKMMEKAIIVHQRTRHELSAAISELKNAIAGMKKEEGAGIVSRRRHTKCLPDTKITLNFPTQERLPV